MFSLLRRAVRALQDEIEDVEEVLPRSGELHRLASAQQETTLRLEQVRAPRMTHGSADWSDFASIRLHRDCLRPFVLAELPGVFVQIERQLQSVVEMLQAKAESV